MSLCLSADLTPLPSSAPGRMKDLGARLRRLVLRFAEPQDGGDLMPAPSAEHVVAMRARRAGTAHRATGNAVNALLL